MIKVLYTGGPFTGWEEYIDKIYENADENGELLIRDYYLLPISDSDSEVEYLEKWCIETDPEKINSFISEFRKEKEKYSDDEQIGLIKTRFAEKLVLSRKPIDEIRLNMKILSEVEEKVNAKSERPL